MLPCKMIFIFVNYHSSENGSSTSTGCPGNQLPIRVNVIEPSNQRVNINFKEREEGGEGKGRGEEGKEPHTLREQFPFFYLYF